MNEVKKVKIVTRAVMFLSYRVDKLIDSKNYQYLESFCNVYLSNIHLAIYFIYLPNKS